MKKTACKALLSLLCAVVLLMGVVPFSAFTVSAEMGCDFPWTSKQTLLEQIIQRDGLLDGVWYPWLNSGGSGNNLAGNDVIATPMRPVSSWIITAPTRCTARSTTSRPWASI